MNFTKILVGLASLMFFMIGADKFLSFLEPPCSLESSISGLIWKVLGVMQIAAGVFLWLPNYRKYVAGFFAVFMFVFTLVHVSQGTSDVGGSLFMGILLGLIVWNPGFLQSKKS